MHIIYAALKYILIYL